MLIDHFVTSLVACAVGRGVSDLRRAPMTGIVAPLDRLAQLSATAGRVSAPSLISSHLFIPGHQALFILPPFLEKCNFLRIFPRCK